MTRSAWCVLAAALLGLGSPGAATAVAPVWVPLTADRLAAAVAAAHTPEAIGYARTNLRRPGRPEPAGITVAATGIPAYTLDPAFVRGDGTGPAAVLAYVAVVARAADGRTTTIEATPAAAGWRVTTALSGDDETRLARELRPGTVLLSEPQINGWYELGPGGVRLLRASLPQNPVGALVPLTEYQHQVHDRYADKQPGAARSPAWPWWSAAGAAVAAAAVFGLRRLRTASRS
ncbi:hypothetical protein [Amycolatopsis australiensis]|uniref:hypothetical protein n=1 Tax=Amycolatopsis australiensis TaxID=546364 RepID=UPI001161177A|nr:hypothetical protein [Amycolatopsis australiensis]